MIHVRIRCSLTALADLVVTFFAAPALAAVSAASIIGVDQVRVLYPFIDGIDDLSGNVQRVAIVDTGIQWNHPALAGRVVAGVNYAAGATYGSEAPAAYMDLNGHGTFVSGVIASSQADLLGVTPNVELVAVRVLAANGQGSFADVTAGLKWVNEHAAALNITAVNVSLGTTSVYTSPGAVPSLSTYTAMQQQLQALTNRGIVTVVASGNSGSSIGLNIPSIFNEVVSVGASTVTDSVASFSNRNPYLEVLAPGEGVRSLWKGSGYSTGSGTSYAAPFVTASAVLLREMLDRRAFVLEAEGVSAAEVDLQAQFANFQDLFVNLIQSTGVDIYDPASKYTYDRLSLLAALQWLDPHPLPAVPEPATGAVMAVGVIVMVRRPRRQAA